MTPPKELRRLKFGVYRCRTMGCICPVARMDQEERSSIGGNACLAKHGPEFYRDIANKRWGNRQ